jgi:hypothetical protein
MYEKPIQQIIQEYFDERDFIDNNIWEDEDEQLLEIPVGGLYELAEISDRIQCKI